MRFICIISTLVTTITILYAIPTPSTQLTTQHAQQDIIIDNIAWLYDQFSLTFNVDYLPLNDYYRSPEGQEHFEKFEEVEDFFADRNVDKYFFKILGIRISKLTFQLEQRIQYHQNLIIHSDETPLSFEAFYMLFSSIKDDFDHNIINKISIGRNMPRQTLESFCSHTTSNERIKQALNQ